MRGLLAIAGLMLGLAACTVVPAPAEPPEPAPGTEAPAPPPAAGVAGAAVDPCGDLEALRQFGRLLDASPEEQRREHLLAQQAFAGDPRESNRRRLILTHALARSAWRDDARVQRLLESGEPAGRDAPCAGGFGSILLRLTGERLRLLREEQRRHELALRDEQRAHEVGLREETRRFEGLLREEKARSEEFRLKLDALIEIDRRLRRDAARTRR